MFIAFRSMFGKLPALRRFCRAERGNVAIVFAFSLITLAVALGGGIDLARAYSARQKLSEVATLACQYASRPSVIQTDASDYSGSNGQSAYKTAVTNFITSSLQAQNFPYPQTTATPFSSVQNGPANVSLTASVPTTFMQIAAITQVPVSASAHCYDSSASIMQVAAGKNIVQESFENPPASCGGTCYIQANGTIGTPATPSSTFPSSPSFTGATGTAWYVTGYCLEIDVAGRTKPTAPNGNYIAELDCEDGSHNGGNSAITTKAYLEAGSYELRYFYASRVPYPDYDPAYICGSAMSDTAWATDTATGGGYPTGAKTNQTEVYLDEVTGATPPLHWTLDGTQQLAGSNLIDVCTYGFNWLERSVRINVTTPAFYWLTFAADGANDSYGGSLDYIRLCPDSCANTVQDNFPSAWLAANNGGSNKLLFEDNFESPVYTGSPYNNAGNMYNSDGTSGSASSGWPSLAASGWALAPTNQLPYWNSACPQGIQCIELGWGTNSLISRPFLLDPGYYQVNYDYLSEITFSSVNAVYCGATPAAANIAALSAQYGTGIIHAYGISTGGSVHYDTNTVGVFMSHAQLASTPNLTSSLGATTTYTNPNGSTSTTPTVAPNGISLTSYNASQVNPLLDICGYAAAPQTRTAYIKIVKPAYYWLTFAALGDSDSYGGFIDDVKLTALGSLYMASPPSGAVTIPVPDPQPDASISFTGYSIVGDPLTP
jgi:Flp pilus assembly protein TadG